MAKSGWACSALCIQKTSQLEPTNAFSEFDFYESYQKSFQISELGKLYQAIPFTSLAHSLGLKETKKGRASYFGLFSK